MTREEAIKIIDCYDIGFYDLSGEKIPADKLADAFDMAIEALSAENSNAKTQNSNQETQKSNGDLIYRADAIEAVIEYWDGYAKPLDSWDVMNQTRAVLETLSSAVCDDCIWTVCNYNKVDWNAPSAEAEDRHYIKIYADDEPSVKAEKLYQICGETQNGEVAEWLKEYFPSAEPKTGEWIKAK